MKKYAVRLLAALAIAAPAVAPAVAPAQPASSSSRAVVTHNCSSGYKHGVIGGEHKCLRRGQFCARGYKNQYPKYGFYCNKRSAYGWRLT